MIVDEQRKIELQDSSLEIAWRNPVAAVKARMRAREKGSFYCQWAEQARKIRARRWNWETNNNWVE